MRDVKACPGTGGFVYTYEGPQFGAQTIEEPCDTCGGFHERTDVAALNAGARVLYAEGIAKAIRAFLRGDA